MRLLVALLAATASLTAQSKLDGLWQATLDNGGVIIPFRMAFATESGHIKGWFFNGDEKVLSTGGTLKGDQLVLSFDQYAATLKATVSNGTLDGTYYRATHSPATVHAVPYAPSPVPPDVPNIAGLWDVPLGRTKGEAAWHLIVNQTGPDVSASVLRIDGDTGALTGTYKDGKFILGHFSGARPIVFEATPQPDGTLALIQNQATLLTAVRASEAHAKGLPQPSNPFQYTTVKNRSEPFRFSGTDLSGKLLSNTDPRFQGKVVILAVGGSWCPNCHDEAPFLESIYEKYRKEGLEVVALSFEEADQLQNPTRVRAFVKEYRIRYPVLLAGEPEQLQAKLPQAENLTSWPTTFFIGRDGLVKAVHAGFAGKVTGDFNTAQSKEIATLVQNLLAAR